VDPRQLILIALVSALVIWKHWENIIRLASGTESKFGTKSGTKSGTESEVKSGTLGATGK
jgi:hypothetical protein